MNFDKQNLDEFKVVVLRKSIIEKRLKGKIQMNR